MPQTLELFDHPLVAAFKKFHTENPEVYRLFVRFALEAARGGRARISADAVCHRIRWYTDVETTDRDGWKINNNWASFYARLFALDYPEHAGLFRSRRSLADTHRLR